MAKPFPRSKPEKCEIKKNEAHKTNTGKDIEELNRTKNWRWWILLRNFQSRSHRLRIAASIHFLYRIWACERAWNECSFIAHLRPEWMTNKWVQRGKTESENERAEEEKKKEVQWSFVAICCNSIITIWRGPSRLDSLQQWLEIKANRQTNQWRLAN